MNLEQLCRDGMAVVKSAGAFIAREALQFNAGSVELKGLNQLVSYVDKTAEEQLVSGLSTILPQAGFITEEQTIATEEKEWMWVIDPLDGTTNFVHGVPVYSISVGLLKNKELQIGIVYEINRNELFHAIMHAGAFLNGNPIRVTATADLRGTLLATGFPYYDFDIMEGYLRTLRVLLKETHGMRRMGSAAVDLAYVACGRFDGFFEYGLNPWDVSAGILLVREAGGEVTSFGTNGDPLFGKEIIASNGSIHAALQGHIAANFR